MKNIIISIILYFSKILMQLVYFFIKIFTKQKDKITMLSRQSDKSNIDFIMLKEELEHYTKFQIKILCKKIPNGILNKIRYCFYTIKCMYHIATSKVCIVDGYNIPISALKHKKNTEIIQIWHALGAVKKFGYQVLDKKEGSNSKVAKIMKMHANYTCITCASNATKKIYCEAFNTDLNKIKVFGMPRIDYILEKDGKIIKKVEELLCEYPKLKEKKNIVYVPTFRKNEKIQLQPIINSIDEEKYNLIIQLHPLDTTIVNEKYKVSSKYSTFELLKIADYIITDYSALAFEIATLNKPLFFYLYDEKQYIDNRGININLFEEMNNCAKTDIKDIISIIESGTYDYEELSRFRDKYVETIDTNNSKRITEYIENVIENNKIERK